MKTTVHIIPHSHWDREWYMAFEEHRMKLVELFDQTMNLFETDESFRSFHLDGQTIMIDDYLEIKPENRERLTKYVRDGKFTVGPWYILQDEFFTSGESDVRNLLVGMSEAKKYGDICRIGYFPDAFGSAGQMPQLLKQAGMKAIVFGRGVKAMGANNEVLEEGEYDSKFSEMLWEAPDGSALPGILFANWYNNGAEIPVEPEKAKIYWDERLAKAQKYAGTSQLLFMNGCDHQPVQKDLSAAIETARKLYPDIEFVHSNFDAYVDAIRAEMQENVSKIKGELTSQETDGLTTLVHTSSANIHLKQMNRVCETALSDKAEPMAVMASLLGKEYPKNFLRYSWKTLMQNHPHDSICGCSVDAVNAEMKTRFDKSRQVADGLFAESMSWVADAVDTEQIPAGEKKCIPFVVFNTTGWGKSGVISTLLDYERCYGPNLPEDYKRAELLALPENYILKDASGNAVSAKVEDAGVIFGYDLPDDKFRQPYMARKLRVTFEAREIPAMGYAVYYLEPGNAREEKKALTVSHNVMENEFLKVEIHEDGTYSLTEKESGKTFSRIGFYEETGDIGNEYLYIQNPGTEAILTKGVKADVELEENESYRCVYRITHRLQVPEKADETVERERAQFMNYYQRTAGRSDKLVTMTITTRLILERSAKAVKVETTIENQAKDHRVRLIVPTGLQADTHLTHSVFEVVERNNRHGKMWKNPSACEHQQNFVAMKDEECGIMVANFGLYEYEILPDKENSIAVTLLRAVSEMGDWGVFPAPAAQLQGTYTLSYEIMPFRAEKLAEAFVEGHQFQTSLGLCQTAVKKGSLSLVNSFFDWSGEGLNLTGFKQSEEGTDVMVRFVNETKTPSMLTFRAMDWFDRVYRSNVVEEKFELLKQEEDGSYRVELRPFEILTVGIETGK